MVSLLRPDGRQPFHRRWLDSDFVVYCRSNSLRAAEVSLSGLHRHMPEEELDLLQFAAGGAAQSGTASAQVVRREVAEPRLFRELLNDVPGKFLGHPVSPSLAATAHTTEHLNSATSCRRSPHASRRAGSARPRLPLSRLVSGACQSATHCSAVNQLPSLRPSFSTPLTRLMPAARWALRSPQSAVSQANRRTAPSRRLIVPGARCRDSNCIR
jgi:hypothetical protein